MRAPIASACTVFGLTGSEMDRGLGVHCDLISKIPRPSQKDIESCYPRMPKAAIAIALRTSSCTVEDSLVLGYYVKSISICDVTKSETFLRFVLRRMHPLAISRAHCTVCRRASGWHIMANARICDRLRNLLADAGRCGGRPVCNFATAGNFAACPPTRCRRHAA